MKSKYGDTLYSQAPWKPTTLQGTFWAAEAGSGLAFYDKDRGWLKIRVGLKKHPQIWSPSWLPNLIPIAATHKEHSPWNIPGPA